MTDVSSQLTFSSEDPVDFFYWPDKREGLGFEFDPIALYRGAQASRTPCNSGGSNIRSKFLPGF